MAPEQEADSRRADHRADVYSLGCTLYYLLTGRAVYSGNTLLQKIAAHREQPIPSLRDVRPDVPEVLDGVFGRTIAKGHEERYQSMSDVLAALRACLPIKENEAAGSRGPPPLTNGYIGTVGDQNASSTPTTSDSLGRVALDEDDLDKPIRLPPVASPPISDHARAARPERPNRRIVIGGLAAAIAILGILLFGVILRSKPDGTVVVVINDAGASIQVLDERDRVMFAYPSEQGDTTLTLAPGAYRLKVEKEGFQPFEQAIMVKSGCELRILVPALSQEREAVVFTAPDESKGLSLISSEADGHFSVEEIGGKQVIRPEDYYLYFQVNDSFAFDVPADSGERFVVELTLFDLGSGWIDVQYDGHPAGDVPIIKSRYTASLRRVLTGSAELIDVQFVLPYARLTNRQNGNADFRVCSKGSTGEKVFALHKIILRRLPAEDGEVPSPAAEAVLIMNFDEDTITSVGDEVHVRDLSGSGDVWVGQGVAYTPDGKVGGGLVIRHGELKLSRALLADQAEFTVTAWVQCRPKGHYFNILKQRVGTAETYSLGVHHCGFVQCVVRAPDGGLEELARAKTDDGCLQPGEWSHVVVRYRESEPELGNLDIWVDGLPVMNIPSARVAAGADRTTIGWDLQEGGLLDELAVFHRALTDKEIQQIYHLGLHGLSGRAIRQF